LLAILRTISGPAILYASRLETARQLVESNTGGQLKSCRTGGSSTPGFEDSNMKLTTFLGISCMGAFLLVQPPAIAHGQVPGGGGAPGQGSPRTMPSQNTPGANNPTDTQTTMPAKVDDKKFAKDAALGGMTEVELGKLAAQKASRQDVKDFAQKMVDDHTKANEQLKQIASHENIPIADSLDSKHQARIDKLAKLSGEDFDKAYVKDQLKDHQADVRAFNAEAQNGTDPNVKAFATNTLPTLQQHLELVKNLNKAEKEAGKQGKGQ
jgi:putative membrane protein